MGLGSLKKVKKTEGAEFTANLSDYSDEEVFIKFRRPKVPDYFIPGDLRKTLLIAFPEMAMSDAMLPSLVLIMGLCYVPEPGEGGMEPWRAIAQMSRDNAEAFLDLVRQFQEAFPASVPEAKADAKNDSAQ